jgi:hypothetical protein
MNTRAYALSRRWAASVLAAGALGAAALGVHLAQAHTVSTQASGTTQLVPQSQQQQTATQRRTHRDDGEAEGEGSDDGGFSSQQSLPQSGQSFQQVLPPGAGGISGPQARTSGS